MQGGLWYTQIRRSNNKFLRKVINDINISGAFLSSRSELILPASRDNYHCQSKSTAHIDTHIFCVVLTTKNSPLGSVSTPPWFLSTGHDGTSTALRRIAMVLKSERAARRHVEESWILDFGRGSIVSHSGTEAHGTKGKGVGSWERVVCVTPHHVT